MCSFAFTNSNFSVAQLSKANFSQKLRGPDNTTFVDFGNYKLLHNLLSITGNNITQPIINNTGDISLLFNGEIYNYNSNFKNDSYYLMDLYENFPDSFFEMLYGEFAFIICDLKRNMLIVSTDIFSTKPLYFGKTDANYAFSTYPSFLEKLDFENIKKCPPNCITYYSLSNLEIIKKCEIYKFKLEQKKDSYEDWIFAFSESIKKRTMNVNKEIFMCLSSGYDSGVIFHELNNQQINFNTYYIPVNEDLDILKDRISFFKNYKKLNEISICNIEDFELLVENFQYEFDNQNIFNDLGARGLYQICKIAKLNKNKILISGQGSDEIFSDYGIFGHDKYKYSTIKGIFPEDLNYVFPWNNFYYGKQQAYLLKEESVVGSCGIESRYPFLDKNVVQEFLFLDVKLKNRRYKAPLDYYLNKYNFPYLMNDKKGFSPYEK